MNRLYALGFLIFCIAAILPASTFIIFDAPGSGTSVGQGTQGIAINDQGVVAGNVYGPSGWLGFVRAADGTINEFDANGLAETFVTAINNAGSITGYAGNAGFVRSAFGAITLFDSPGGPSLAIVPQSINNFGVITGYWIDAQRVTHGFIRTADGALTSFDAPSQRGPNASPEAINDSGFITGQAWELDCICGFVRSPDGQFTFFSTGAQNAMYPLAINASGEITGWWLNVNGLEEAFVRSPSGVLTTFAGNETDVSAISYSINASGTTTGVLGAGAFVRSASGEITVLAPVNAIHGTPVSINNFGAITGYSLNQTTGSYSGFILLP